VCVRVLRNYRGNGHGDTMPRYDLSSEISRRNNEVTAG